MTGLQSGHSCPGGHCPEPGPLSLIYSLSSFVWFPTDDWHLAICFILYTFCWRCGWQLVTLFCEKPVPKPSLVLFHFTPRPPPPFLSPPSPPLPPPYPLSPPPFHTRPTLRKTKCWGRDHVSNLGWVGMELVALVLVLPLYIIQIDSGLAGLHFFW